ncbi:MAG: AAA family ATPase [Deltaproteobacteria bacterium]|nr:AAA family ATPase [Deltaproteobacteria bacterium]
MIIRELRLNPFAGLADQKLHFVRGLNVVVGPNEAGKSTIVNALKMVLFVPTNYDLTLFKKEISRYMPLTGGDTIQVELSFLTEPGQKPYRLFKAWGAKKESRLVLPDGGILTDPQKVQDKLRELLVLKEGTYHGVLFAYQSRLGTTLEALSKDPEPRHHLADVLRRVIYQTDGVSVDLLGERLQERSRQFFSRWDQNLAAPQGNRGIEHPWKREVGEILKAYYDKERLRQKLEEALEYERDLDAINERIRQVGEELQRLKDYVAANAKLVEDARRRRLLKARLDSCLKDEGHLKDICKKWPVLEEEVRDGAADLERLRKKQGALAEELSQARTYESQNEARERFRQAEKKRAALIKAQATLADLREVSAKDLETLEDLHLRLAEYRASLQAGKLRLNFTPAVPMTIQAAKDLEAASDYALKAGQVLELDAGGFISLEHADWELTVKSGEIEFEQLAKAYKQTSADFHRLLKRLGVQDVAGARKAHETYHNQVAAVKRLEDDLEEILAGQSYEDLKAAVQQALQAPPSRSGTEVAEELGETRTALSQAEKELAEKRDQLSKWQDAYKSLDSLVEKLADLRGEVRGIEQVLAQLAPLPPEVTDEEAFINEFKAQQVRMEEKQKAWHDLLLERSELQGRAPGETAEDIVPQLQEAERLFEETLKEGEALITIQKVFEEVKAEMDGQTLSPWLSDLGHFLGVLTDGRYVTLEFPDRDSEWAVRQDGLQVPGPLLSGGARVSLGLAVRLSMARHFLQGLDGFLVMDDPIVELDDAGRQQAAAQVIQEFAKEKQVIVLTCKQAHAELLGGHRINLTGEECFFEGQRPAIEALGQNH